jgi:hypothetical protein
MTYDDVINWFSRHDDYSYTFINGRMFIQEENAADLFDKLNEGKLNEIGGKRAKDTHIVYRDNDMVVLVPLSFESAKSFSRNTQYCTGGNCSRGSERTSKNMYNQHTKEGDILFRIFFKDGTKVRLTWNGDINDKDFHWGLGKKDSYPTFTNRNMSNPFDLEQVREIRLQQLEIDFETEPKEKEFDEWEKKFCSKWGWDVHSLWDVYQKIRKKWGFPDWKSGDSKPMDPEKHRKMQEEEEDVYIEYEAKKKAIFGKYYGKTAWWNDGHEMLYKAVTRIPNKAITKMVEYAMNGQYKPKPIDIKEDVHLQDNMSSLKPGDTIWVSRVNPELRDCDSDSYNILNKLVGDFSTVVGVTDEADLCRPDEEYDALVDGINGGGILIYNPKLKGHDGFGESKIKDDNDRDICEKMNCWWINSHYATFTKGEPFDTHNAFDALFEQEGDDEFGWVTDIGLPKGMDEKTLRDMTGYNLKKLSVEELTTGLFVKRRNGKFLYELGEPAMNLEFTTDPGFMLKNLSNGKFYFTKTKHILRDFWAIVPKD